MSTFTRTDTTKISATLTAPISEHDSQWNRFENFVKKIAAVPKEEVDGLRAEYEREKKERKKRAG